MTGIKGSKAHRNQSQIASLEQLQHKTMATTVDDADQYIIEGAHGTIAEQKNEAFYDDRSDADDDMEKGRITFPTNILYGRERELEILRNIYGELVPSSNERNTSKKLGEVEKVATVEEEEKEEPSAEQELLSTPSDPLNGSIIVFLSGYSGIGKSALVKEFVKQIKHKYNSSGDDDSTLLHATGKFTEQSGASAPFSALAQALEWLAMNLSSRQKKNEIGHAMCSKVWSRIRESELIGPGTEGGRVLRATFPEVESLLDGSDENTQQGTLEDESNSTARHSMNAIKECTREILSVIAEALDYPLVLFLDDLQWADAASLEILSFLLSSTELRNIMFICAYRSNEVDEDHPFSELMENVTIERNDSYSGTAPTQGSVKTMDLVNLSPQVIAKFIADSIKKEENEGVAELAEAVYTKTMGNIFFVVQALEELVRKNILFYDVMCFEWRWVVSKLELENFMSDDVVEMVKGKMRELSNEIQKLLVVMAYIPKTLDLSILNALMKHGGSSFEESSIRELLRRASDEGMLIYSTEDENYVFAHDRIRQSSLELAAEEDQTQLLLHISSVLLDFASSSKKEWCRFVAVDLLNSLPSDKINWADLIKLNMSVSKTARSKGSIEKENELLHRALKGLKSSGMMWKEYDITLEVYNSVIVSEHSIGSFDKAKSAVDAVLQNAKSLNDKMQAYHHQLLCQQAETSDYMQALSDGLKVLDLCGLDIPKAVTKTYMIKEEVKLKIALRNRAYSCLEELPTKEDHMISVLSEVLKCALFTGNPKLVKIVAWKAIQLSIKRGVDQALPTIIVSLAMVLADQGNTKTAQELGQVVIALSKKDHGVMAAYARMLTYGSVVCRVQPFRSVIEPMFQCHKDLKLIGNSEGILGSILLYFVLWIAAGLELDLLLESQLLFFEDYCRKSDRSGFLTSFQIFRQFELNLRTRMDNPTEFQGEAFHEENALNEMNSNARKMALRDSSSLRLQLAFVFWNEDTMTQMLKILLGYPMVDSMFARLHIRLCFVGLAAFALGKRKDCESFLKLGQDCLSYFKHLMKEGSANAKPVYFFMLAMKSPSREAFKEAIFACTEASMNHLEAMVKERYAVFLNKEGDATLANDYIASSYWLYKDWGAHAKTLQLSQQYDFLKHANRKMLKV